MKIGVVVMLVAALTCLAVVAPAEATCFTNTVAATYVFTLAGVNASGFTISHLGVVTLSVSDANGNGPLAGTMLLNERGFPGESQQVAGTYTLASNCFITVRVNELVGNTVRVDSLLGYVSANGGTI